MDWTSRVLDVHTYRSKFDIQSLFSRCGEILSLYPWKTDKTDKNHYFIEYDEIKAVERARAEFMNVSDIQVHPLARNAGMQDRFLSLASGNAHIPRGPRTSTPSDRRTTRRRTPPYSRDQAKFKFKSKTSAVSRLSSSRARSISSEPSGYNNSGAEFELSTGSPTLAQSVPHRSRVFGSNVNAVSSSQECTAVEPISPETENCQYSHDNNDLKSITPVSSNPILDLRSQATHISIYLCSEVIRYDLEALEDSPNHIISLLEQTKCGRESWTMVAAHYRRKGKPHQAISVISKMLEIISQVEANDHDLNPAFLMLAQCHHDLAKRSIASDESNATQYHARLSLEWLQRIYGAGEDTASTSPEQPVSQSAGPLKAHSFQDIKQPFMLPKHRKHSEINKENQPYDGHNRTSSFSPSEPHFQCKLFTSSNSSPPSYLSQRHCANTLTTPNVPHIKQLQNELQSLRARYSKASVAISTAENTKRKAENEAFGEREKRRKLEQRLEETEAALAKSQRMEGYANDEINRGVESRKRAEELLAKERTRKADREAFIQKKATQSTFEGLAEFFRQAAHSTSPMATFQTLEANRESSDAPKDDIFPPN